MVNISIIQMQSIPLKVEENLLLAERLITQAAKDDAELVVLPELFNVGFYFGEALMDVAETLDGKTITWLKAQAVKHHIYITGSIYERNNGRFYNTMVMVGYDGSVQQYRKRNPTWPEFTVWQRSAVPGPAIFDTPFGRIGGVICFDSFARETVEGFRQSNVDLIVIVACWGVVETSWRPDSLITNLTMRSWSHLAADVVPSQYATELNVPVVFVNQGGSVNTPSPSPRFSPFPPFSNIKYSFHGNSHIRDASGKLLTQAEGAETTFCAVIPVDIQQKKPSSDMIRVDIAVQYLSKSYYFVQPPLFAKVVQAWSFRGFQKEYQARCKRQKVKL